MGKAIDAIQHVRGLVPYRALPGLAKRRTDRLWEVEEYRLGTEEAMRFLLEHTDRAGEVPELARAHSEYNILHAFLRYHPRRITKQQVRGIEWLTTRRDPSRPMVLSFIHHAQFDGMFGSLRRHGVDITALTLPWAMGQEAPKATRQHIKVVARGATLLPAEGGTQAVVEAMKPGVIMAIASDIPGQTEVTFLNRRVRGSFGAARIAALSDAPVVLVTSHREGDGSYLQVHEPLEPRDFADPADLLAEMLRIHGEAVLAWPEAQEMPLHRWGRIEADAGR